MKLYSFPKPASVTSELECMLLSEVFLSVKDCLVLLWVKRPLFQVRVDGDMDSFLIEDESDIVD